MRLHRIIVFCLIPLLANCATETIAQLKDVKVDLKDEKIDAGLDKTVQRYQLKLDQVQKSSVSPDFILRLADSKIKMESETVDSGSDAEKTGQPTRGKSDASAGQGAKQPGQGKADASKSKPVKSGGSVKDSIKGFEKQITSDGESISAPAANAKTDAGMQSAGTQEAIELYLKLLSDYPTYKHNDRALYQLARAYEEQGDLDEAIKMLNRLVKEFPHSRYIEEVQFRRGEYFYTRKKFPDARDSYKTIVSTGPTSSYFEFSLYKLGWTLYKLEQYEDAIQQFVRLLDHKIATGTDLEHPKDSFEEKRIEDAYRVISLSFSSFGGPEGIAGFFEKHGKRKYENSIYKDLGDYYLEKRRYSDATAAFKAFVKNNPYHKLSPYFSMWAIDSDKKGGFSTLVIGSYKEFVTNFGLKSAYWTRFNAAAFSDVSAYVKTSLKELANYYHAQNQDKRLEKNKDETFREAEKWYREILSSYPKDANALTVRYQLAQLLHENKRYSQAVVEYEAIAYGLPANEKSSAAGYAAVLALRESLEGVAKGDEARVKREVIRSSLKFGETFPKNEKTPLVLSLVMDDIYKAKDYPLAISTARKLLAKFPNDQQIRRAATLIVAHSSFELGNFNEAEEGYKAVLGMTDKNDPSRAGLIENLAASYYKQGEKENKAGNYKMAATYFLKVATQAPTASICPVADFDGATALIQAKDWDAAAGVLRSFRTKYPGHALGSEVTKKIAFIYKEAGNPSLAAAEYERIEADSKDEAVRRDALELAAELYVQAKNMDKAVAVYRRYVSVFPKPLEYALEMRNKIALYLKSRGDMEGYLGELKKIMETEARAGSDRTDRTRYLGATATLVFAEQTLKPFTDTKLVKPFAKNLLKKKEAMKTAKEKLEKLFDYEVGEVTSAATFYLAEMYYDFSRALVESERPDGLNDLEKEQYELSIEEQAFPFEEKAIQVHEKNLELMTRGIYNSWIDKSILKLAKLMPARYSKFEESSGYIEGAGTVSYPALVEPKPVVSPVPTTAPTAAPVPAEAPVQAEVPVPAAAPVPVSAPPAAEPAPALELTTTPKKEVESR